jgi:hypothetical protein
MKIAFHPEAEKNFNNKVEGLLQYIEKKNISEPGKKDDFVSEREPKYFLEEKDITPNGSTTVSYRGETKSRYFEFEEQKYGLSEISHIHLIKVASTIQSLSAFREICSCEYVQKIIFLWLTRKFCDDKFTIEFTLFFIESLNSDVIETTTWIPIANLEVEISFKIANSEIRPISKKIIDVWSEMFNAVKNDEKSSVGSVSHHIKTEFQGLAAVVTTVTAESSYAKQISIENAQTIISVLSIFSGAVLIPDIKCLTNLKGFEHEAVSNAFIEFNRKQGQVFTFESAIAEKAATRTMRLSKKDIAELQAIGLDKLSSLLIKKSLSEFERQVLHSVLLYAKAAFTSDPTEKIIYILTSLESLLLKSDTEPIQHNLSDRFSIFYGKDINEKKELIKILKEIYEIRSRYLHHGQSRGELDLISNFLWHVRLFYLKLLHFTESYTSKEQFLTSIDDQKYN